jgi:hypothetical protein
MPPPGHQREKRLVDQITFDLLAIIPIPITFRHEVYFLAIFDQSSASRVLGHTSDLHFEVIIMQIVKNDRSHDPVSPGIVLILNQIVLRVHSPTELPIISAVIQP